MTYVLCTNTNQAKCYVLYVTRAFCCCSMLFRYQNKQQRITRFTSINAEKIQNKSTSTYMYVDTYNSQCNMVKFMFVSFYFGRTYPSWTFNVCNIPRGICVPCQMPSHNEFNNSKYPTKSSSHSAFAYFMRHNYILLSMEYNIVTTTDYYKNN